MSPPIYGRALITPEPEHLTTEASRGARLMISQIGWSDAIGARFNGDGRRFHEEEASWSTRGEHRIVPNTSHFIQLDRPDAAIVAIRGAVATVGDGAKE
ncbi:hypothetical protein [Sphingopyxis fribergensis]|uniref:hypothetical protein n=1 Tax=Sphingopyxis fribergensis TaxID=1515612 RepID=UPI0011DCB117|nr:hypothetical protein [Sphingopyxis fribergensis]